MANPRYKDFAAEMTHADAMERYRQQFVLNPDELLKLSLPVTLEWQTIRFEANKLDSIVAKPGVYAFSVGNDAPGFPPHGYVLYIGQTDRTLRTRSKEYLREKTRPKRPRVYRFLTKWSACLFFHYAEVDPTRANLLDIEAKLSDALLPPYNQEDFSPEIRGAKRMFEAT